VGSSFSNWSFQECRFQCWLVASVVRLKNKLNFLVLYNGLTISSVNAVALASRDTGGKGKLGVADRDNDERKDQAASLSSSSSLTEMAGAVIGVSQVSLFLV